jgi:hypothetical protein
VAENPATSALLRRPLNLRVPDCRKLSRKSPAFSGTSLKYSQISEMGSGEWFDTPLRDREPLVDVCLPQADSMIQRNTF